MELYDGVLKDKPIFTGEEFTNAVKKSYATGKKRSKLAWNRGQVAGSVKTGAIALLAASILAGTVALGNYAVDKHAKDEAVKEYGADVYSAMADASDQQYGTHNMVSVDYYDTYEIANFLLSERKNFDVEFYKVYDRVKSTSSFTDVEIRKTMNEILFHLRSLTADSEAPIMYADFKAYVEAHNFIDDDGQADYKKYNEQMREHILNLYQVEQAIEDNDLGGR